MSKHTAGKWYVERDGSNPYIIDATKLVRLADICTIEHTGAGGSTKGNAYLIAAAPEMLRALQDLCAEIKLSKLNIRKDFSLINAHASALKAIYQAGGGGLGG